MSSVTSQSYYENFLTESGKIIVWKTSGTLDGKKASQQKKEWEKKEVLRMINSLGYTINNLQYKPTGQPMLDTHSKEFISISHSKGWFAIYIADKPVGIDIEVERNNILEGKHWFLNELEISIPFTNQELHLIWGAKEAYFKKCEGQIDNLKNDVWIENINSKSLTLRHEIQTTEIFHKKIQNAFLVWL